MMASAQKHAPSPAWGLIPALLSTSLLAVGPQWAQDWSEEHLPALYDRSQCATYTHLFFLIGVSLCALGLTIAFIGVRGGGVRGWVDAVSLWVPGSGLALWLIAWWVIRGGTRCIIN